MNEQSDWERIDAFWKWWPTVAAQIADGVRGEKTRDAWVEQITEQVQAIGELSWEIGSGTTRPHCFVLTAEGKRAERVLAEKWLSRAPKDSEFEFFSARQVDGNLGLSISMDEHSVDFASFMFGVELDETRRRANVVIHHPAYAEMPEEVQGQIAGIFLDHILGEDECERWVGEVSLSAERPEDALDPAAFLAALEPLRVISDDTFSLLRGQQKDGSPVIATINLGIKRVDHLLMDAHCEVHFVFAAPTENGFCTAEESEALNAQEDALLALLGHDAVYIGRVTASGKRVAHFHIATQGPAEERIRAWAKSVASKVTVHVEHDPAWTILDQF